MYHKNQATLVWDTVADPPPGYNGIVFWKRFVCEIYPDAISMPKVVEQNAGKLKKQYLKFIYDIGIRRLKGQSIIDHMELRKNFNYWWMTLIVEKCNYSKSTWINDAIRLLAFEKIITNDRVKKVRLVTSNKLLAKSFRLLCLKNKIEFNCKLIQQVKSSKPAIKRFYELLPLFLQGISFFCFNLVRRWPLRGAGLKEWKSTKGRTTFISYLDNLVSESAKNGHYDSRYWANLPDSLFQKGVATNWLHIYVKDKELPSEKQAVALINKFNQTGQGLQTHVTLDTFLSWKVIRQTLLDWTRLFKIGRKFKKMSFPKNEDNEYLWQFIECDLEESLYGRNALGNLLNFNLFEKALALLPKQKNGVYLQENQSWEFGIVQTWKLKAHGELIGVPHSTVRFWDLRYFFDSRSYKGNISNQLPRPSKVAVHGKLARKMYLQGGYPKNELIDVEALRYLYLNTDGEKKNNFLNNNPIVILVLGDYLAENTYYLMRILEEAYSSFSSSIKLFIKPHPNCPIIPSEYPRLKMEVTMDSISSLLSKCTVAYTTSVTSAAIDAYCANVPVISALNPQTLNMSPLRGIEGVEFVSNAGELVNAINKIKTNKHNKVKPEDFFFLDTSIQKWKNLLDISLI